MTAQRYDQCDDTCTADCGHCKGHGRPTRCGNCGIKLDLSQRVWLRPDGSPWCVDCGSRAAPDGD